MTPKPTKSLLISTLCLAMVCVATARSATAQSANEPAPSTKIIAETPLDQLRDKMRKFVETFYLSGENLSRDEITEIYAERVDYFKGKQITLEKLIKDKLSYFKRWPKRSYQLDPETLTVVRGANGRVIEVLFEYDFDVSATRRRSQGRGIAMLTVDFSVPGGRIVRERGKVIKRGG